MRKNQYLTLSAVLISVLLISIVSANTFIVGLIEDSTHTGIPGVDLSITCNYGSSTETQNTTSLSDGVYAVEFSLDGCDTVDVSSTVSEANVTIITYIPTESACTNCGGSSGGGGGSSYSGGHPTVKYTPLSTTTETEEEEETPVTTNEETGRSWLTGSAVLDFATSQTGIITIIVLVLIIGGTIFYFVFKKKISKKSE